MWRIFLPIFFLICHFRRQVSHLWNSARFFLERFSTLDEWHRWSCTAPSPVFLLCALNREVISIRICSNYLVTTMWEVEKILRELWRCYSDTAGLHIATQQLLPQVIRSGKKKSPFLFVNFDWNYFLQLKALILTSEKLKEKYILRRWDWIVIIKVKNRKVEWNGRAGWWNERV